MTKEQALQLIKEYVEAARGKISDPTILGIRDRWSDGDEAKANRWLGFVQGVMYSNRVFSLEELKEHSRQGTLA